MRTTLWTGIRGGLRLLKLREREDKPVLLSVGYSACHWCHVMEHESFENEDIAKLMNDNFVNIKVDREERPDVDHIYMTAVQLMTHRGGWPMTVFLTPDAVPFYAGTYFPPEDRHNMPGFPRVLISMAEAFRERADDIAETASSILDGLRRSGAVVESDELLSPELLDEAYRGIIRSYDPGNGGFGSAPKFPPAMALEFLLHTFDRTGEPQALEIVRHTSRKMAEGGIYDHLGGGFHRYSTDSKWLVPHFEKMLYDNALLSRFYLHYYQVTNDELARSVVEGILDYVVREMTDALGGFYSTQDADSEGVEGKFFVWSLAEIKELLGEPDAELFAAYYNVTDGGNFEEANILNVTRELSEVALTKKVSESELRDVIERGRAKLFAAREQRVKPGRDEKILTAWNGLMLASFAEAAAVLNRPDYEEIARQNARFVLDHLRRDGLLLRTYKEGQAKLNAYLEDYAFFIDGLLALYETTGELEWFEQASALTETMIDEFWDEEEGGFFFTGKSHETLIVRAKDFFDNATPSGNSVAAEVLLRIGLLTNNTDYRRRAATLLRLTSTAARRYPTGFGRMLCAFDFELAEPREIAVVGNRGSADTAALMDVIWKLYLPNRVIAQAHPSDSEAVNRIPLLHDRPQINGAATAYVCRNFTCLEPVNDPEALTAQLKGTAPTASSK